MIRHYVTSDDPEPLTSGRFILHYRLRNPRQGGGHYANGVRDENLLHIYMDGLTRLYSAMTSGPWSRPPLDKPVHVFVAELKLTGGIPFTFQDDINNTEETFIALPCRSNEPMSPAEQQLAAAQAVHEAAHVFNSQTRPLRQRVEAWNWFDEALATFMETVVLPDCQDFLRFLGGWVEKPHLSLDSPVAGYQASRFITYLVNQVSKEYVNEVWVKSVGVKELETPIQSLMHFAPAHQPFLSTDPDIRDLFASGYCLDTWFMNDPSSCAYAPEVYARFGERAVTHSFELKAGDEAEVRGDMLDHLACRYYRFYLKPEVRELEVTLRCVDGQAQFKAELACADRQRNRKGEAVALRTVASESVVGEKVLRAKAENLSPDELDHLVLVVTNCGITSRDTNYKQHDDQKEFSLRIAAA